MCRRGQHAVADSGSHDGQSDCGARSQQLGVAGTGGVAVGHSDAGCDFYAGDVRITATVGPAFRVTNARTIEQPHPEPERAEQLGVTECWPARHRCRFADFPSR